ncbi:MAG: hypothetical protein AAFS10_05270 [Myxococcota bacterium]
MTPTWNTTLCLMMGFGLMVTLSGCGCKSDPTGTLELAGDKETFKTGDTIKVKFTAANVPKDAWVGIIPSDIEHGDADKNDDHDVAYQHLDGKTKGTLRFTAPSKSGKYDFRLNEKDSDGGIELASVSFTVKNNAELTLKTTSVKAGDTIKVRFKAPKGLPDNAWVGIIPSDIPHGDADKNDDHDVAYKYLKGKTKGTLTFTAPSKAGKYDFRLHNQDAKGGKELASVSFTVK